MNCLTFKTTELAGLVVVEPNVHPDDRGVFARTFCRDEFSAAGLPGDFVQSSTSFNRFRGILRGLHFQLDAAGKPAEGKLVRCTRGSIFDVAVDIRPESPTFGRWHSEILTADNRRSLFIPPGFAHGFQALEDQSEVYYQITVRYEPERQRGIRWDDKTIAINWPVSKTILSEADKALPELTAFSGGR